MCTGIQMTYPQGVVMGRTMDVEGPVPWNMIYQPANYPAVDDIYHGGSYYGRYARLGIGFRDRDPLKEGINDQGLIGITNEFVGPKARFAKEPQANKKNLTSYHFLTYALAHYGSVQEMIDDLDQIQLSKHDRDGQPLICPDFHYMFTDSSGACLVLEPDRGQLVATSNPYGVMTNSPRIAKHFQALEATLPLDNLRAFNAAKDLPGGYDPKSRFIKAYYLKALLPAAEDEGQAQAGAFDVLAALSLPRGFLRPGARSEGSFTRYSSVYASQSQTLTVRSGTNPMPYQVSLKDLDQEKDRRAFFLADSFQACPLGS
ncbi:MULTISPECIES: linear amide C-N hydrolase [Aerococcus]|uniref:Linear amide C-N hydrolase n=1 Tax=Aerococcus sanguinicola TaxID=119206 RepID=A0A5N1GJ95_9LACT|nr:MULTISPECIES: linear amide C-N hydrolase [Aerococcus]KAA9300378.1 linear amide C-N hydrolase [Aerococcus sanguinicola]MDK6368965.1 linear amide C-N hydrolase [Aerococcus sp. UMB9870]MDK6678868.1 linear amide C-N hydrolase [Aerococcus sp. UMB8608]MDK6686814.1 linear amide C-N hydrolase [Aerococcus sp. UMB8623]MDK6939526.1 linear amide C-N hydrolase [Aerococcus sp. UMB8487]